MLPRPSGLVALLTDFPPQDPYVGILKGALLRASTKVQVVDFAHGLPPQDLEAGAFFVATAVGRFAPGTVHVAIVDPGVGTSRRLLAAAVPDGYWLAPDNGLLAAILAIAGVDVRAIDIEHLGIRPESSTFDGRDVLGPVAAWLATGRYGFSALGPRVLDASVHPWSSGQPRVIWVDGYGNLITNVDQTTARGLRSVRLGDRTVPMLRTYGDVGAGDLLAYVGSFGLLEVAQNCGNAAATLGLARGAPIEVISA